MAFPTEVSLSLLLVTTLCWQGPRGQLLGPEGLRVLHPRCSCDRGEQGEEGGHHWGRAEHHHTACPGSYRVTHGISHATWQNPYLMAKTMQYDLCHAMTFLMGYSKTHASHILQWYEFSHAITRSSCSNNDAPLLIMQFNQSAKKMHYRPYKNVYRLSCSFHVPGAIFSFWYGNIKEAENFQENISFVTRPQKICWDHSVIF